MAKNPIDPNLMYKVGFTRGYKGENKKVQWHNERMKWLYDTGIELVGTVAVDAIKQGYGNLRAFKNAAESQLAPLNLKVDKIPDNPHLRSSIAEIKKRYDKAARTASLGIGGKRRSKARMEMAKYMSQLHSMNAALQVYNTQTEKSKGMAKVYSGMAGENNAAENKNFNPGSNQVEMNNTLEQANGRMGKLLRWNIDEGRMEVVRNGEWGQDEQGYDVYLPKASTGDEVNEVKLIPYKDLRFAMEEDNTMESDIQSLSDEFTNAAWGPNAKPWELIGGNKKSQFVGKVMSYSDSTFKDFFFGGFTYDYSTNRMDESAPAYMMLREQDAVDGNWTAEEGWKEGYGPGSKNWEARLMTLKDQDFSKGSQFRKDVAEDVWSNLESQYKNTYTRYQQEVDKKNKNAIYQANLTNPNVQKVQGVDGAQYPTDLSVAKQKAQKMVDAKPGEVIHTPQYTFKILKDGMVEVYQKGLNKDQTQYIDILYDTMPINQALSLRGLGDIGVGYQEKVDKEDLNANYLDKKEQMEAPKDYDHNDLDGDGVPNDEDPDALNPLVP